MAEDTNTRSTLDAAIHEALRLAETHDVHIRFEIDIKEGGGTVTTSGSKSVAHEFLLPESFGESAAAESNTKAVVAKVETTGEMIEARIQTPAGPTQMSGSETSKEATVMTDSAGNLNFVFRVFTKFPGTQYTFTLTADGASAPGFKQANTTISDTVGGQSVFAGLEKGFVSF